MGYCAAAGLGGALIGARGVGQFITVRVDFDEISERVFAIHHAVGLLSWIVFADGHPLLAAVGHDFGRQALDVRVLYAKMKDPGFPIFEVVLSFLRVAKFEYFNPDLVAGGQVRNSKTAPALAENVLG